MMIPGKKAERDSNIELLRLLCMFGIVVMHSIGIAVFPEIWNDGFPITQEIVVGTIVCSFTILSVNIFGLISGYYGIRFSWYGIFKLYLCCAFYGAFGGLIGLIFNDGINTNDFLLQTLLPFTNSVGGMWYINCYVGLYLLSPILNKSIQSMTKQEYMLALFLLSIVNIYFGRYCHVDSYNGWGYSLAQLIFLYFIGGFLRQHVSLNVIKQNRGRLAIVGLLCISAWISLTLWQHSAILSFWSPTAYNHIVTILASVCVFLLVLSWSFKTRIINYLATGSLAVYLMHMNEHVWTQLQPIIVKYADHNLYGFLTIVLIALIITILCACFDQLRIFVSSIILWMGTKCVNCVTSLYKSND